MKSLELLGEPAKDTKTSKKKKRKNLRDYSEGLIVSECENVEKKTKKEKKIKKKKFYEQPQEKTANNSNLIDSSKKRVSKTESDLHGHLENNGKNQRMKRKKKKKKGLVSLNQQSEANATQTIKESPSENAVEGSTKKKKHKKRMYVKPMEEGSSSKDNDEMEPIKKKRKLLNPSKDEYYPGMLSEMLQIKKFGRLIIPWDPSFGLDPNYKIPECNEEGLPKLKINPLFDLSKRNDQPSKDNSRTLIFVGNLPIDTTIIKLKKLFKKCGLVLHAKIRKKESNQKNVDAAKKDVKYRKHVNAVVRFSSSESCEAALKMNGDLYEGHHLRVNLANDEKKSEPTKCVFIGNLAYSIEDDDLWKAFGECGPIENVRVVRDGRSGKGKGFGYVNFKSADSVENAVKLDGCTILNREIRVRRNESGPSSLSDSLNVKRRKKKKKKKFTDNRETNLGLKREGNDEESKSKNKLKIKRETNLGLKKEGNEGESKSKDKLKTKKKKKQLQAEETESIAHEKSKKKKKLHKKISSNQNC